MKARILAILTLPVVGLLAAGGEFINLGFNEPDLSHARLFQPAVSGYTALQYAPVQEAFRGWTVSDTLAGWPYEGLVTVRDGGAPFGLMFSTLPSYAPFEVAVDDEYRPGVIRAEFSLSQRGTVPEQPSVLWFDQYPTFGPPPFQGEDLRVAINGSLQPVVQVPSYYNHRAVDVSAFAGQEIELKFVFPAGEGFRFDVFGFRPIPEPSTWLLLGVGGAVLAMGRLRRRRGRKARKKDETTRFHDSARL